MNSLVDMKKLAFLYMCFSGLIGYSQKHDMYLNNILIGVGATPGAPSGFQEDYQTGFNIKFQPSYYLVKTNFYLGASLELSRFETRHYQDGDTLSSLDEYSDISVVTPAITIGRKLWVGNHLRFFPTLKLGYSFINYSGNYLDEDHKEGGFSMTPEFYTHFYVGRKLGIGFYGSYNNVFVKSAIKNPNEDKSMGFFSLGASLIYEMNWL